MTFGSFSTPRFPCSPIFISQPLQWIWECPSFIGEKPFVESEVCCQSVGIDLFLRIFNRQRLWEPKANAWRLLYMYPVAKSLMKPQVDKMYSGRMCKYLIGWVDFDGFQGGMMSFYTDSLDMQSYYPVRVGGDKIKTSWNSSQLGCR